MNQRLGALLLTAFLAEPNTVSAQSIVARGGEHSNFSRVVLTTPENAVWSVSGNRRNYQVNFTQAPEFNLSELFSRIPRNRLLSASVSSTGRSLELELGCDCTVNAWQERLGLIVIDILDAVSHPSLAPSADDPTEQAAMRQLPTTARITPAHSVSVTMETAQAVGSSLALRLQASAMERPSNTQPASVPPPPLLPVANLQSFARPFAQAIGQGVLEPALPPPNEPQLLLRDAPEAPPLPSANVRVSTALSQVSQVSPASSSATQLCDGSNEIEDVLNGPNLPFNTVRGATSLELFGEFDQPNPQAHFQLVKLYLASGFGAEARTLIENMPEPIAGRDLLLGFSDVLENRSSNSRLRLSQAIACGGATSVLAALAGASTGDIEQHSTEIVLAFSRLPPQLQAVLGPEMIQHFLDANAVDAARIVAEGLRRSNWVNADTMLLIDTRLDRGRGRNEDALSRMLFYNANDLASYQERLDILLVTDNSLPLEAVADIEASASAFRHSPEGQSLMATLIEVLVRSGDFSRGFQALDRLKTWLPHQPLRSRLWAPLNESVWQELAAQGSDLEFLTRVLQRADWQNNSLSLATRDVITERMSSLGLEHSNLLAIDQTQAANAVELATGPDTPSPQSDASLALNEAISRSMHLTSGPTPSRNLPPAPPPLQGARVETGSQTVMATNSPSLNSPEHPPHVEIPIALNSIEGAAPSQTDQEARTEREPTSDPSISAELDTDPTPNFLPSNSQAILEPATPTQQPAEFNPQPDTRRGLLSRSSDLLAQSAELQARLEALLPSD